MACGPPLPRVSLPLFVAGGPLYPCSSARRRSSGHQKILFSSIALLAARYLRAFVPLFSGPEFLATSRRSRTKKELTFRGFESQMRGTGRLFLVPPRTLSPLFGGIQGELYGF